MRKSRSSKNLLEVLDFLKSLEEDFYFTIEDYYHYTDKVFDTTDLTITDILHICEAYLLKVNSSTHIINYFDVPRAVSLVLHRIENCGDEKLKEEAFELVMDMPCFNYKEKQNVENIDNNILKSSSDPLGQRSAG